MITLITGEPGNGKTSYVVSELMRPEFAGRPLFTWGIPDLKLPHQLAPPIEQWTTQEPVPEDPRRTRACFAFPPQSLLIIDDAADVLPPRSSASKSPDHVNAMSRHRHTGIDIWIICQRAAKIDGEVRGYCGRHLHIKSGWAGRRILEWGEVRDPSSRADCAAAVVRSYKLPKQAFGQYKSATEHLKVTRRIPKQVTFLGLAVVVCAGLGYRLYGSIATRAGLESPPDAGAAPAAVVGPGVVPAPAPVSSASLPAAAAGVKLEDWKPRLLERPETAPIYDTVRVVRTMPVVAGCVSMGDRCTCYTQQGTDAYVPADACIAMLDHPAFNPWKDPAQQAPKAGPRAPVAPERSDAHTGARGPAGA